MHAKRKEKEKEEKRRKGKEKTKKRRREEEKKVVNICPNNMELILMGYLMYRTIKNEEEVEVKEEEEEEVFSIIRLVLWNKDTIQPQYSFPYNTSQIYNTASLYPTHPFMVNI